MSGPKPAVQCDVVGCSELTRSAREFDFEATRRVWMMVCDEHRQRLDAGQPYTLVNRPFDLRDPTGNKPALFMEG